LKRLINLPHKVEIGFTDSRITGNGGHIFLSKAAKRFGLPALLKQIRLKQRRRGSSDSEQLLSLIYNLASGQGHLSDLDALRSDTTSLFLLGLGESPGSRRLGDYLRRFSPAEIERLHDVSRQLVRQVAPAVIAHAQETKGYIPVFVDGTAIEVSGQYFEGAGKGYNGELQYWLHGVFVDGLWVSGRLHPGGTGVTYGWKEQLDKDVTPLLAKTEARVWARTDNAYYAKDFINYCHAQGWDYSVSVTNPRNKEPILEQVKGAPDHAWTSIGRGEEAMLTTYQPYRWALPQTYVVIRSLFEGYQKLLFPRYTVILVSRSDLPLEELVKCHRGKQGQENAFKGPLIDLDLHHPPCQSFHANQAVYACGLMAQVLLRAIQFNFLPQQARCHGIRPIIRYLIRTAAQLVRSARRWRLAFSKNAFRLDWLCYAAVQLE